MLITFFVSNIYEEVDILAGYLYYCHSITNRNKLNIAYFYADQLNVLLFRAACGNNFLCVNIYEEVDVKLFLLFPLLFSCNN